MAKVKAPRDVVAKVEKSFGSGQTQIDGSSSLVLKMTRTELAQLLTTDKDTPKCAEKTAVQEGKVISETEKSLSNRKVKPLDPAVQDASDKAAAERAAAVAAKEAARAQKRVEVCIKPILKLYSILTRANICSDGTIIFYFRELTLHSVDLRC